jgi:hypothetical protein
MSWDAELPKYIKKQAFSFGVEKNSDRKAPTQFRVNETKLYSFASHTNGRDTYNNFLRVYGFCLGMHLENQFTKYQSKIENWDLPLQKHVLGKALKRSIDYKISRPESDNTTSTWDRIILRNKVVGIMHNAGQIPTYMNYQDRELFVSAYLTGLTVRANYFKEADHQPTKIKFRARTSKWHQFRDLKDKILLTIKPYYDKRGEDFTEKIFFDQDEFVPLSKRANLKENTSINHTIWMLDPPSLVDLLLPDKKFNGLRNILLEAESYESGEIQKESIWHAYALAVRRRKQSDGTIKNSLLSLTSVQNKQYREYLYQLEKEKRILEKEKVLTEEQANQLSGLEPEIEKTITIIAELEKKEDTLSRNGCGSNGLDPYRKGILTWLKASMAEECRDQ